jgi:hypothetical protein
MKLGLLLPLLLAASSFACAPTSPQTGQGGANPNDRTSGGDDGEKLLTGAMIVSSDGEYAVLQRNTVSVLLDVKRGRATELPFQGERFVFSKTRHVLYAVKQNLAGVAALDLDAGARELWSTVPAFVTTAGARLMRVSDDDRALVLGDQDRVFVMDPASGDVRGVVSIGSVPTDVAFLANGSALFVGTVTWQSHQPSTAIVQADLKTLASKSIQIPNCDAPIEVLPDGSRALLSPTYCQEGQQSSTGGWTNPDPVSVIDLLADGPRFRENLPGFGPVALVKDGKRAIAYLDTKRMDPSMFADKSQVPSTSGDRYHLMVIDPVTLKFSLSPIGDALPRFAMTLDGKGLLVDATVTGVRGGAYAKVTIGPEGLQAQAGVFGGAKAPFGYFDLETKAFTALQGPAAPLDRFVQTADGKRVFTLKTRDDGLGGDLFAVDLVQKTTADLGKSLRDIAILPDGRTLILRIRLPAVKIGASLYTQEDYCFSLDGVSCESTVRYQSTVPVQTCEHDCF